MIEAPRTRAESYTPNFRRLMSLLFREVSVSKPSEDGLPNYASRPLDRTQDGDYPRLLIGFESEHELYKVYAADSDEPLHAIGHVNKVQLVDDPESQDCLSAVNNYLTLEGKVIRSGHIGHNRALNDDEVGKLADVLAAS